jgi:hypothetical protein
MTETANGKGSGSGLANARKDALAKPGLVQSAEGLAIMEPPSTPEELADYGRRMGEWILGLLSQDCSPCEREAWQAESPPETLERVHDKLSEVMIRTADVYTWRLQYCPLVAEWYQLQCKRKNGLRAIKRYHAAIENRLRIDQGEAKGKVTAQWVQGRENAIRELRPLFDQFNREVKQRMDMNPTFAEASARLLEIIDSFPPGSFLHVNAPAVKGYLDYLAQDEHTEKRLPQKEDEAARLYDRAIRIRSGRETAADFFIGFGAWHHQLTEDTFRNYLSRAAGAKKVSNK